MVRSLPTCLWSVPEGQVGDSLRIFWRSFAGRRQAGRNSATITAVVVGIEDADILHDGVLVGSGVGRISRTDVGHRAGPTSEGGAVELGRDQLLEQGDSGLIDWIALGAGGFLRDWSVE